MDLYNAFSTLDPKEWQYYSDAPEMDFSDFNHENAYRFIRGTYQVGAKDRIFDVGFQGSFEKQGKHEHTVALYFLGCRLNKVIKERLQEHLTYFIPSIYDWYDFRYTWYLTCLYHDTAAVIEKNEWNTESSSNIDFYLDKYDVQHNIFKHNWINPRIKPYTYSECLVKNYFRYRVEHFHSIDHGIIAGYLLYDRLVKNYNDAFGEYSKLNPHANYDCFHYNNLKWRKEHMPHFAIVADAIIAHNIWRSENTSSSKAIYLNYGLDSLIYSKSKKINIKKNPLVFFLGLIDTIEPVKFFSEVQPKVVLESIKIDSVNANQNQVNISMLTNMLITNGWYKIIKNMEDWLAVKVEVSADNVKIVIK